VKKPEKEDKKSKFNPETGLPLSLKERYSNKPHKNREEQKKPEISQNLEEPKSTKPNRDDTKNKPDWSSVYG
jgi:hypothetical protein